MSISINNNLAALTALGYANTTNDEVATSVQRLSTGLAVNTPADNPVDFATSVAIQNTIAGLQVANTNTQTAMNLAKTADNALGDISDLLQSLKAVVVAAGSATQSSDQAQGSQQQIASILQAIDRLASTTSFGGKNLLDGSSGNTVGVNSANASSLHLGSTFGGQPIQAGTVTMQQVTAATGSTTGALANTFAALTSPVNAGSFTINGDTIAIPPGSTVSTVLTKINAETGGTHVAATFTAGQGIKLTSTLTGTRYGVQYTESANILNGGAIKNAPAGTNGVYTVTVPTGSGAGTSTETFVGGASAGDDGLTLTSPSGARLVVTSAGNAAGGSVTIGAVSTGAMNFQVGRTATDTANLTIPSMASNQLAVSAVAGTNLSQISVLTNASAQAALATVDAAASQVSMVQSQIGSFQGTILASSQRTLATGQENAAAANSLLRDVDMATEMTNFSKLQIVQQAQLAVIAQANKIPQNVLDLLK